MPAKGKALICEGYDAVRPGQEVLGNPLRLLVLADENSDVSWCKTIRHGLSNPSLHPSTDRIESVVRSRLHQHLDFHPTRKALHRRLTHVIIDLGEMRLQIP